MIQLKTPRKKTDKTAVLLGIGVLNWPRAERVGDRYGVVFLNRESGGYRYPGEEDPREPAPEYKDIRDVSAGEHGRLVAVVLKARESGHIGDLFHGVGPRTPKVGRRITLGTGTLFFETAEGMNGIGAGLRPDDGRATLWLKIRALYDCHDQTVELWFYPS